MNAWIIVLLGAIGLFLMILALSAIRVVQQYARGVIFVLGRLTGAKGPDLFLVPPYFLLAWQPISDLRDVFTPDLGAAPLSRTNGREAPSEAEALRRWLADGGDLDIASLYGLEIIVGDDTLDWFSSGREKGSVRECC